MSRQGIETNVLLPRDGNFIITPALRAGRLGVTSAPTSQYDVANKLYVDNKPVAVTSTRMATVLTPADWWGTPDIQADPNDFSMVPVTNGLRRLCGKSMVTFAPTVTSVTLTIDTKWTTADGIVQFFPSVTPMYHANLVKATIGSTTQATGVVTAKFDVVVEKVADPVNPEVLYFFWSIDY